MSTVHRGHNIGHVTPWLPGPLLTRTRCQAHHGTALTAAHCTQSQIANRCLVQSVHHVSKTMIANNNARMTGVIMKGLIFVFFDPCLLISAPGTRGQPVPDPAPEKLINVLYRTVWAKQASSLLDLTGGVPRTAE